MPKSPKIPRWPDRIIKIRPADVATPKETAIDAGAAGVVVCIGNFNGYELGGSLGAGATSTPIGRKMKFANRSPLVISEDPDGTARGVLTLALFRLGDKCGSYEEAGDQADAWAGEVMELGVTGTVTTTPPTGNLGDTADLKSHDVAPNSNLYLADPNGGGTTVKYRANAVAANDRTLGLGVDGLTLPWEIGPGESFGPIFGDFYFASADGSGAEVDMMLEFYEVIV